MDQQKLRSLVFEKTGVKIDVDDPIFALVALNEAVLQETVERHVAQIEAATRALTEQASTLHAAPPKRRSSKAAEAPPPAPPALFDQRLAIAGGGAAVLCAVLVLAGQAIFFKPPAVPAPIVQAKELTAEQSAALKNHEKLNKVIQKLDQKTRNTIAAEMQKP
jgi:hypothetical protein